MCVYVSGWKFTRHDGNVLVSRFVRVNVDNTTCIPKGSKCLGSNFAAREFEWRFETKILAIFMTQV